jgi:class 3 adenylate cyclase/tetratricopeptide (TPR) repeat protein
MISPGRRLGREVASDSLFANLDPPAAANALSRALSMAREALLPLGQEVPGLLRADRTHIWVSREIRVDVDVVAHEEALRSALSMEPGPRDGPLSLALAEERVLLEDEPYADWAIRPREALELLRQRARLELARDRTRGRGRAHPEAVVDAWENCLSNDPTSEEAASALMRIYAAQGRRQLGLTTYEHCRTALEGLGLHASPALVEARRATLADAPRASGTGGDVRAARSTSPRFAKEERRLVSVLFAELAAPIGIGRRLDPEDLRDVVGGALAGVIAEVEALGGMVTSVSGAGLVALFGAPEAHEDDPERSVRAGFRVLAAIAGRDNTPGTEQLSVRIGIETGRAVVGPFVTGAAVNYGAVGEVVAIAAALQSAAKTGSVLVGPVTRAATEGIFDWGPTEEVAPGASAKPLTCSYPERPKARSVGYHGQRKLRGHAPLVGRQAELSVLGEVLQAAVSGRGSVAFVVGEPGLGKTRLVQECRKRFMAWVGAGTGRLPLWLEGRGASYASSTPYGLYQQLLSTWIGVAPEEGEEVIRPALERAVRTIFGSEVDHLAFLVHLMGLGPGPDGSGVARLSPEDFQQAMFAAMRAVMARLAEAGPTVLVLEDLHWADPTSLRLTEEMAALAQGAPLLLMATRRPEPDSGVSALESSLEAKALCPVHKVELLPLSDGAERELALSLVGGTAGEDVIDAVCTNVEGNPLFLEERFSSLVETGALVRDKARWSLCGSSGIEIPDALERLIRARVDRLGPILRDTIAAASVLGAEFSLSALGAVTRSNEELPGVVEELCTAGLLREVRQLPVPVYRFHHALIQDATYGGMLRSQRRELHARAAWGLEMASAGRLKEVAAVLGHHYALAGETERAIHHLEVAGDHAASVFANDEAIASYRQALTMINHEGVRAEVRESSVGLWTKLAKTLQYTGRYADARDVLQVALHRVSPDDRFQAARLHAELGGVEIADHNYDAAIEAFDVAEELLGEHPDDEDQAVVDLWLGILVDHRANIHYWRNEPDQAAAVLARARPVVEAQGTLARKQNFYMSLALQRARQTRYRIDGEILGNVRAGVDAAPQGGDEREIAWTVFCLGFFLLWHGDLADAQEQFEASLRIVERTGDPVLRARCLCYLNVAALRRHDVEGVRSLSRDALAAAEAVGYPEYVAAAKGAMAWTAWRDERFEEVVALADTALELWGHTVVSYSSYWICLWPLIAVRLKAGLLAEAVFASRKLLVPPQQRLPDELESLVESAGAAWDDGEHALAARELTEALELACNLGYA